MKGKSIGVPQLTENGVDGDIDNTQGRCRGMSEVQKLVAVSEVKKTRADSVQADFRASRQKISADAGRGGAGRVLGTILHSVVLSNRH